MTLLLSALVLPACSQDLAFDYSLLFILIRYREKTIIMQHKQEFFCALIALDIPANAILVPICTLDKKLQLQRTAWRKVKRFARFVVVIGVSQHCIKSE